MFKKKEYNCGHKCPKRKIRRGCGYCSPLKKLDNEQLCVFYFYKSGLN